MHFEVVTPQKLLLEREVDELTAPGAVGEFGVLPGHVPFLTALRAGVVRWSGPEGAGTVAVGRGYAEVSGDRVVLLVDSAMLPNQIDREAVAREATEAQQQLDQLDHRAGAGEEAAPGLRTELEARRDWAQARLDASAP